jgi:predicted secreted Zn-dependent protease
MRACILVCLLGLAAAPAQAADHTPAGERLLLAPPTGWQPVQLSRTDKMVVTRLYPPGQDEKSWTEILTVQIYPKSGQTARQFADSIVQYTRDACEAAGPSAVNEKPVNGYPMASVSVTCSKGKASGQGGFVLVTAIQGKDALYAVQRQWRGAPFGPRDTPAFPPDMLRQWSAFIHNVSLCDTRDSRHPCP